MVRESVWCGNGGLRVKEKACEGEGVRVGISLTVRKKRDCVCVCVCVLARMERKFKLSRRKDKKIQRNGGAGTAS